LVRVFALKIINYLILPAGKCTCGTKFFGTVCYGECPAIVRTAEEKAAEEKAAEEKGISENGACNCSRQTDGSCAATKELCLHGKSICSLNNQLFYLACR
jgi:hypothetical protein